MEKSLAMLDGESWYRCVGSRGSWHGLPNPLHIPTSLSLYVMSEMSLACKMVIFNFHLEMLPVETSGECIVLFDFHTSLNRAGRW